MPFCSREKIKKTPKKNRFLNRWFWLFEKLYELCEYDLHHLQYMSILFGLDDILGRLLYSSRWLLQTLRWLLYSLGWLLHSLGWLL